MNNDTPSVNPFATPDHDIVSSLLIAKGVADNKWGHTIASILGVHYSTAQRLLSNEDRFELGQLRLIAAHFGTSLAAILNESQDEAFGPETHTGHLILGPGCSSPCRLTLATSRDKHLSALVAYKQEDGYVVSPPALCPAGVLTQPVAAILFDGSNLTGETLPVVAVLDDAAPKGLVHFLRSEGFNAIAFTEPEPLIALIESGNNRPDAYILDWTLKNGQTALGVIQSIRSVSKTCPILLLSGTIRKNGSAIGDAVAEYDIEVNVKPSEVTILSKRLAVLLKNRRPAGVDT
jgi:hypothetical protein